MAHAGELRGEFGGELGASQLGTQHSPQQVEVEGQGGVGGDVAPIDEAMVEGSVKAGGRDDPVESLEAWALAQMEAALGSVSMLQRAGIRLPRCAVCSDAHHILACTLTLTRTRT